MSRFSFSFGVLVIACAALLQTGGCRPDDDYSACYLAGEEDCQEGNWYNTCEDQDDYDAGWQDAGCADDPDSGW